MRSWIVVLLTVMALAGPAPVRAETASISLDVVDVMVHEPSATEKAALNLMFSPDSTRTLAQFTLDRLGTSVDVFVGDTRLASVFIMSPILEGNMMLEVPAGQDVQALADELRSGTGKLRIAPRN